MREVEELTRHNTGTVVTVAADYGGQWDIARAARLLAEKVELGTLKASQINVAEIQSVISLSDCPPPDLCIRTGGESRISNFLLWQFAYTELYFSDCYWPDFDDSHFELAMVDYRRRPRRFGHLDTPSHSDEQPAQGSSRGA
jgi:undecaprenyl diphosphate synthase